MVRGTLLGAFERNLRLPQEDVGEGDGSNSEGLTVWRGHGLPLVLSPVRQRGNFYDRPRILGSTGELRDGFAELLPAVELVAEEFKGRRPGRQ